MTARAIADRAARAMLVFALTGTLDSPIVTDAGRRYFVGLLRQLTDRPVRDMFAVARFPLRARVAGFPASRIDAWAAAFQVTVAQSADRSCPSTGATS